MIAPRTMRNRRQRLYDEQRGECWYCSVQCWMPLPGPPGRQQNQASHPETMATVEHQHDRRDHFAVVRQVMACADCNSRKGGITHILIRAAWETGGKYWDDYGGEGHVVQQASGEAAGPAGSANLHFA